MPLIILLIVSIIFKDGTPFLFNGQEEVFTVAFWFSVGVVGLHLLFILLFGGLFAAAVRKVR